MFDQCQFASVLFILIASPALLPTESLFNVEDEEFCERETFEASCSSDEVILIRKAVFGRMNLGRCVENGYGQIGCSSDVLAEVENQCSGRQRCQFPVGSLHSSRPCPAELISFLKVSYDCIKVMTCSEYSCNSGKPMRVILNEGYLASVVTLSAGCGSESCPWVLQALPGQRFNLTFRSFARGQSSDAQPQQPQQTQPLVGGRFCQRLATVIEISSQVSKDVTLCDSDVTAVRLMTSTHDEVKVKLYYGTPENPAYFIVHYEVIGCPDPDVPQGAWMKRSGNTATVGCPGKSTTWHLTCNSDTWTGVTEPCQSPPTHDVTMNWGVQAAMEKAGATTEGILVVVGLGVIIGVLVGCLLLAVVVIIIRRRRRKQVLQYERRLELLTQTSPGGASDHLNKSPDQKFGGACDFHQVTQSLIYDSGFGTYETHSYTSPLPDGATASLGGHLATNKMAADAMNCAIHGDHTYESHTLSR